MRQRNKKRQVQCKGPRCGLNPADREQGALQSFSLGDVDFSFQRSKERLSRIHNETLRRLLSRPCVTHLQRSDFIQTPTNMTSKNQNISFEGNNADPWLVSSII